MITSLIAEQKARGVQTGDHFAKPGSNDRLWSALEKLAVTDPETFVDYFANDVVNLVSVAWLGPNYQIVSDPNVVNPGGTAQTAHRDYHLGFMDLDLAAQFPAHVHRLSPVLTLQGAVAHVDMPVETGPTMYLPHSQKYEPGYMAIGLPEFQEYFDAHYVQLPLEKGDAVFFNPALLHGAGTNRTTDVKRMANLLQVSSAFGRALGTVDTERVAEAVYPTLRARKAAGAPENGPAQRRRRGRRGLPLPDEPGPRHAGRLAEPGEPGAARLAGAGRTTGTRRRSWPSWPRRPSAVARRWPDDRAAENGPGRGDRRRHHGRGPRPHSRPVGLGCRGHRDRRCGPRPGRSRCRGGRGARLDDAFALIDSPDVDAVVIASHDSVHAEQVVAAARAGKAVLCEKPLAPTLAEGRQVLRDIGATGEALLSLGFMRRFDPGYVQLRQAIDDGTIGPPVLVHNISRGVSGAPNATSEFSITGSAIHEFDVVPWLLRSPVVEVSWVAPRRSSQVHEGLQDPQLIHLRTADGVLSTCETFLNARYGYDIRCEVVGETGAISLTEPARVRLDAGTAARRSATPPTGGRGSPTPTASSCRPGSTPCWPAHRPRSRPGGTAWPRAPWPRPSSRRCTTGGRVTKVEQ